MGVGVCSTHAVLWPNLEAEIWDHVEDHTEGLLFIRGFNVL